MSISSENPLQVYSSAVSTSPAAVTSTTAVACGLGSGPGSTTLSGAQKLGDTSIVVASATSFYQGEHILIDGAKATAEIVTISKITSTTFTLGGALVNAHAASATVVGMYAGIQPYNSGRLKIEVVGSLLAGSTASTVTAQLYIGSAVTVAAPANAAAFDASAVAVGSPVTWVSLTGSLEEAVTLIAYLGANSFATDTAPSGGAVRTVGVPYYVDVGLTSSTGTIQLVKPTIVITANP